MSVCRGEAVDQTIRFCMTPRGVRLAYASSGQGRALVKVPNYLTHLERDWDSPVWRHWLHGLSSRWRLIRYDQRGCGLSDLEVEDFSLGAWLEDLETVVDSVGLDRFSLLGMSAGAATAIAYAARHPERVDRLVLYGGYAKGRNRRDETAEEPRRGEALLELMRIGWGQDNPAFRRVFTTLFVPEGTPEQVAWFDDLQRVSTTPENAVRFTQAFHDLDVSDAARTLQVPTLVLHARRDAIVPFDRGRELAALIPGAEFVPLESANHVLLAHEQAWERWLTTVEAFLARPEPAERPDPRLNRFDDLSPRELEVVGLIAQGLSNDDIAVRLTISPATVRNHITRILRKLGAQSRAQVIVLAQHRTARHRS
jgi:pimeloyl-ACP methyl ester carboxylesterase/DNA-binding CsgD family transcriptional regulator